MEGVMGYPGMGETTGSLEEIAAQMSREKAQQYGLQAKQLALQGRQVEANIANQKAQIELRKAELAQQKYLTERSQQLQGVSILANLRGPGNAAQYIDAARRLTSFGAESGALRQIADGGMPQGAFAPGASQKPVTLQERLSGMLGAGSGGQGAIDQRDRNDRQLAGTIASSAGQLARGSLESLSPYELKYLGSYAEAEGHDMEAVMDAYRRAGIHQGGSVRG